MIFINKNLFSKTSKYLPQIVAMLFLAGFIAYAWTEPASTPPEGNVDAPVNVSADNQTFTDSKTLKVRSDGTGVLNLLGGLGVNGLLRGYSNAIFDGWVGIGTTNPQGQLDVGGGKFVVTTEEGFDSLQGVAKVSGVPVDLEPKSFSFGARNLIGTNNQSGWTTVASVPFKKAYGLNKISLIGSIEIKNYSGHNYLSDQPLRLRVGDIVGPSVGVWQSGREYNSVFPHPLLNSPYINISTLVYGQDYAVEVQLKPYNDDDYLILFNILFTMDL